MLTNRDGATAVRFLRAALGVLVVLVLILSAWTALARDASRPSDDDPTKVEDPKEPTESPGSPSDDPAEEPANDDMTDDGGSTGSSGDDSDSGASYGADDGDDDSSNSGSHGSSGGSENSGPGSSNSGPGSSNSGPGSLNSGPGSSNSGPGNASSGSGGHGTARGELSPSRNDRGERINSGEVVLVSSRADAAKRVSDQGLIVMDEVNLKAMGLVMVRVAVPDGSSERDVMETLRALDPTGVVTFNHLYEPARGPRTAAASPTTVRRSISKRARGTIGLVDAGVDTKHPLLRTVTVMARAFGTRELADSHGTAVASRLANAAPGATIVAASVFTMNKDGQEFATADAIVRGLDWLAQQKVPVINMSLTGPANPILEAVATRLAALGYVLVAAVGNEGPHGAPQYPAAYRDVVGVTAVDDQDRIYIYANQGDYVDFAAAGVDTTVANTKGRVTRVSGTSYAAPIITATLARMIDTPDPERAKAALTSLRNEAIDVGAPGRDPVYGYGVIHAPH